MGLLDRFEQRLDRLVNGAFAKAFKAQVQPVEIASALQREMDDRAAVVSRGRTVVPNVFTVDLSEADSERLMTYDEPLRGELVDVLREYAEERLEESPRPPGMTLAAWYERHRDELVSHPTDRANALAVAAGLLPLFEDRPDRWAAIRWLNAAPATAPRSFAAHLDAWRREAPARHTAAIETIAAAFGELLPERDRVVDSAAATP